jgi:hypothetical protein
MARKTKPIDSLEKPLVYLRGWPAYIDKDNRYRWWNNNLKTSGNDRVCKLCKKKTKIIDGVECDPCLGKLPGVKFACCGHGAQEGYILFDNNVRVTTAKLTKRHLNLNRKIQENFNKQESGVTVSLPLCEGGGKGSNPFLLILKN